LKRFEDVLTHWDLIVHQLTSIHLCNEPATPHVRHPSAVNESISQITASLASPRYWLWPDININKETSQNNTIRRALGADGANQRNGYSRAERKNQLMEGIDTYEKKQSESTASIVNRLTDDYEWGGILYGAAADQKGECVT
jgi:hypothetical protein